MVIFIYLAIVFASATQSATTKLYNSRAKNPALFNAIKAGVAALAFALSFLFGFEFHLPTLFFALGYGASLCLSMYAGYRALCSGPMALTSMLVSFSLIIPLLWGVTVGGETLSTLQCVAFPFLALSIVLTNADKFKKSQESHTRYGKWFFFVFLTFVTNGICSVLQKQHQTLYPESYSREFMFFAMLFCTAVFSAVTLLRTPWKEIGESKGKIFGALSGLANALANYLTLLLAGMENASVLFPVISAGTILAALLFGRIFFREKLKPNHYLAIAAGITAVVLIKL
jgi:drug/metabolite transporter (DMT)-like permease